MRPLGAIITLFVAGMIASCSSSVRVTVRYNAETNEGRPLYLMVRSGQVDNLSSQPYDEAADMVFAVPRDPSVEKTEAVLPGHEQLSFYIKKPEDADLVIYFFFTKPRAKWLYRIPRPIPSEVEIVLGDSEVLNQ